MSKNKKNKEKNKPRRIGKVRRIEKVRNFFDKVFSNPYFQKMEQNKTAIMFTIILIIAIFTRVYRLGEVPRGVNVDEAGIAYDAYCMANYGTDRFTNSFPLYMFNFGFGQSALYTYIASFFIKIFGFSIAIVRLPAVILGLAAIVLCFFMVKKQFGDRFALTFMALVTICPWHIMASRWGLDCNLLAPMSVISMFLILRAKNTKGYIFAGISFGLTLYTYALSYIILPIFLALTVAYMLYTRRIKFKNVIIMGIPIFILAIPLILMILVNMEVIDEIKGFITIPKLYSFRANSEISLSNIFENMSFFTTMFTNDPLPYNALPEYGTLYPFASFLAIMGLFMEVSNMFHNIKQKKFELNTLFVFLFTATIICMLIILGPNINKSNAIFIPLLFFTCIALRFLYRNYRVAFLILVGFYIAFFLSFQYFYFNVYEVKYKDQIYFEYDLLECIDYVEKNEKFAGKKVNITAEQPYIYTLFYSRISPYEFQEALHNPNDFRNHYGRYYFNDQFIDTEMLYIIKSNDKYVNTLKSNHFTIEPFNNYVIAYYNR